MQILNRVQLSNAGTVGAEINAQSCDITNGSTSSAVTIEQGTIANLTLNGANIITQLQCDTLEADNINVAIGVTVHTPKLQAKDIVVNGILSINEGSTIDLGAFNSVDSTRVRASNFAGSITSPGLCTITNLFLNTLSNAHSPQLNTNLIWLGNNIFINLKERSVPSDWIKTWFGTASWTACILPSNPSRNSLSKTYFENHPIPIGIYFRPEQ